MCVVAHFGVTGVYIVSFIIGDYLVPYKKVIVPYTARFNVANLRILLERHV